MKYKKHRFSYNFTYGVKYSDIHMYARTPDVLKEINPTVYEVIREKEIKNAFKLKPMPSYNPNI